MTRNPLELPKLNPDWADLSFGDTRDFYDRGAIMRLHQASGLEVFMFKALPGVYFDARGKEVSIQLAKEAGHEVERYAKDRKYQERMAVLDAELRAELAKEAAAGDTRVVVERDGLRLIAISGGRHYIEDADGRRLTKEFLTEEQGRALVDKMAPEAEAPQPVQEPEKPAQIKKGAAPPIPPLK